MDIGIIGSGRVAQTLAEKLLELGHTVTVSSRDTTKAKDLGDWGTIPSADAFAAAQRELGRRTRHQRHQRRPFAGRTGGRRRRAPRR